MTKLKPCPFCGGEGTFSTPSLQGYSSDMSFYVECDTCGCSTSYKDTGEEAITLWNARQSGFDWKLIKNLDKEPLTGISDIVLCDKNTNRYILPNIWALKGVVFISEGDYMYRQPIDEIKKQFTHYALLTPPQSNHSQES